MLANTLADGIASFVNEITVEGVGHRCSRWIDGLLNDESQSHERVFVADAHGQLLLIGGISVQPVNSKSQQVILLPTTFGGVLVVVIDGRLLTSCQQAYRQQYEVWPVPIGHCVEPVACGSSFSFSSSNGRSGQYSPE